MPRVSSLLRHVDARPPLVWTGAWVCERLREAIEIERRLPSGRRNGNGNGWPSMLHDFEDMVHWDDARQRVWSNWRRARGAYPFEISRMEEAQDWLNTILRDHEGERRCLIVWAMSTNSVAKQLRRRGWSRATFYRRVVGGSARIAAALNQRGVRVR